MSQSLELRPSWGPNPFKRNACLALRDGELIVTDGKGSPHRFPLDKTKGGPAFLCTYKVAMYHGSGLEQGFLDARRQALVRTWANLWDTDEMHRLAAAADLIISDSQADAPVGDRPGCVELKGAEGSYRILVLSMAAIILATAAVVALLRLVF
jgi:hypothetical protein